MSSEEVLGAYVGAFVDEMASAGVRHAVICPGSRSTPLAMTLERHPGVRIWMHLDERSAAYFALGMARARREPVAVLSTSGTAAANFLPAVIEARYGRVPLLVLTADRPPELQDVGAPQTIDQSHLYGCHVKWFVDMGLPEATASSIRFVRTIADRAAALASDAPAGPVHLNFPFREPLIPPPFQAQRRPELQVSVYDAPRVCSADFVARIADELSGSDRGIIVCGPQSDPVLPSAVMRLARALAWPVLADPLSQARSGPGAEDVIATYDAFLRDASVAGALSPDVVIRIGAIPTSKPLWQWLQRQGCRQILIDPAGWNDPIQAATDVIHADPAIFTRSVAQVIVGRDGAPSRWWTRWQEIELAVRRVMREALANFDEPFEGKVFAELGPLLSDGATLWAGSSMPVRDLDGFFPATDRSIRFLANRGANGIDGVVSSALGAATTGPLLLVVGDLSFYHDMNGLAAARLHDLDATIVILNNDGGGIFSFLPQAGSPGFETLFGTPHGLNFGPAVEMYGGSFERVDTWERFRAAVRKGMGTSGLTVIEFPTDREGNVALHRQVWGAVAAELETAGAAV